MLFSKWRKQFLFCRISTGFQGTDFKTLSLLSPQSHFKLRPTTAIIRFLFCVKVGRPRTSCLFFHKTGSKLKEEGQSWFCCYSISPYGIKKKKTIYSLAHFPHYYHYPGPFFLTITTRFCDKRNCFETWYTSFIWCHKVPPLSSSPPERLLSCHPWK